MTHEVDAGFYKSLDAWVSNYYDLDGGFGGGLTDSFRIWFFAEGCFDLHPFTDLG